MRGKTEWIKIIFWPPLDKYLTLLGILYIISSIWPFALFFSWKARMLVTSCSISFHLESYSLKQTMPFCHDENHVQTIVFFDWTFDWSRAYSKIQNAAERTWKIKFPQNRTFSTGLCFTHFLTAKTCLEAKLPLHQERVCWWESTQVNRNILWSDWYSDICLNFHMQVKWRSNIEILWFGEMVERMLHLPWSLSKFSNPPQEDHCNRFIFF